MLDQLPATALVHVLSWLPDPQPLQQASRLLQDIASSSASVTLWLQHWAAELCPFNRPLAYAVLTCKKLRGESPVVLAQAVLEVVQHSSASSDMAAGSCDGERNQQDAVGRARQAMQAGDWRSVLQLLCPQPEQHLLSFLALGGHATTVQVLLAEQPQQLLPQPDTPQEPITRQCTVLRQAIKAQQLLMAAHAAARAGHHEVLQVLLPALSADLQPAASQGPEAAAAITTPGSGNAAGSQGPLSWGQRGLLLEAACASGSLPAVLACRELLRPCHWTRYVLPAAAHAADPSVTEYLLQRLPAIMVTQQLAVALCVAGKQGHLQVVELLLQCDHVSPQPLKLAAEHAASHGWAGPALRHVLERMLRLYKEDATPLLAPALASAIQHRHSLAADELWHALQSGVPSTVCYEGIITELAQSGQLERVEWVLKECPYVLVRLGAGPAKQALEHGHIKVAELLMMHGDKPDNRRAAELRGRVVSVLRQPTAADLDEGLQLLHQVMVRDAEQGLTLILDAQRVHGMAVVERILTHLQSKSIDFPAVKEAALLHAVQVGNLELLQLLSSTRAGDFSPATLLRMLQTFHSCARPELVPWLLDCLGAWQQQLRSQRGRQTRVAAVQQLRSCFWRHLCHGSIPELNYLGEDIAPSLGGAAFSRALPAYIKLLQLLPQSVGAAGRHAALEWPTTGQELENLLQQVLLSGSPDLALALDMALQGAAAE